MPVSVSYPGLYIEELPSSAHTITAAPTSITVFVGYVHPFQGECARRGYWGKPLRIFDFSDFERLFGGLYNNTLLGKSQVGYAVSQFFLNDGADAYVVGLQPKLFSRTDPSNAEPLRGTSGALAGITFTAQQLTDEHSKVVVTIRQVVSKLSANDTCDIMITYGSVPPETYRGVQLDPGTPATFIANRLASSRLVTVAPGGAAYPTSFTIAGPQQSIELGTMPGPTTFAGDAVTSRRTDFTDVFEADSDLDKIDIFNILAIPGVADNAVWSAALHFCQDKRAFFIMDPPESSSADGMGGLPTIESIVRGPTVPNGVPNGAMYFHYLKTIDPLTGNVIHLPPSGYVAGVYARTDTNRGVWKAPAGLETSLLNTTGVVDEGVMTDMRQGTVNALGVNVLRSFPGSGTVVWGARTITQSTAFEQWHYVPVRRTALFIEQTLLRNLGWVVFEPNDEPLWSTIRLSVSGFMLSLFRQGAFQGSSPSQAFMVKCDATTTRQEDIDNGKVIIVVGFRPLKPAEFVIIQITQLAGQVQ